MENKKDFCEKLCLLLRETEHFGSLDNNPLAELRYKMCKNGDEFVIPVFTNGSGEPNRNYPNGYYAINVTGDSNIAILTDVVNHFTSII